MLAVCILSKRNIFVEVKSGVLCLKLIINKCSIILTYVYCYLNILSVSSVNSIFIRFQVRKIIICWGTLFWLSGGLTNKVFLQIFLYCFHIEQVDHNEKDVKCFVKKKNIQNKYLCHNDSDMNSGTVFDGLRCLWFSQLISVTLLGNAFFVKGRSQIGLFSAAFYFHNECSCIIEYTIEHSRPFLIIVCLWDGDLK